MQSYAESYHVPAWGFMPRVDRQTSAFISPRQVRLQDHGGSSENVAPVNGNVVQPQQAVPFAVKAAQQGYGVVNSVPVAAVQARPQAFPIAMAAPWQAVDRPLGVQVLPPSRPSSLGRKVNLAYQSGCSVATTAAASGTSSVTHPCYIFSTGGGHVQVARSLSASRQTTETSLLSGGDTPSISVPIQNAHVQVLPPQATSPRNQAAPAREQLVRKQSQSSLQAFSREVGDARLRVSASGVRKLAGRKMEDTATERRNARYPSPVRNAQATATAAASASRSSKLSPRPVSPSNLIVSSEGVCAAAQRRTSPVAKRKLASGGKPSGRTVDQHRTQSRSPSPTHDVNQDWTAALCADRSQSTSRSLSRQKRPERQTVDPQRNAFTPNELANSPAAKLFGLDTMVEARREARGKKREESTDSVRIRSSTDFKEHMCQVVDAQGVASLCIVGERSTARSRSTTPQTTRGMYVHGFVDACGFSNAVMMERRQRREPSNDTPRAHRNFNGNLFG